MHSRTASERLWYTEGKSFSALRAFSPAGPANRYNKIANHLSSALKCMRGKNQKWPTSGQGGYVTPAASGIPSASEQGAESELAHLWARWLHNPCRLGDPQGLRAGGKIRSGPLLGKVAT